MKLKEILKDIELLETAADLEQEILSVSYDSRRTQAGDLFIALPGYAADGYAFIGAAKRAGAVCVLCEKAPQEALPYVLVANARRALAVLGANFFRHPANEMQMIAVTGTCGKTTTTYLLKDILEKKAGAKVGLIGTNQNLIGDEALHTERTTPESFELQQLLRRMADAGCTHVVMETSSHALFLDRVWGVPFALGIFTNLTQDHLDFHETMENYCDAKAILFRNCAVGVVNGDDPWTERLLRGASCRSVRYGEGENVDLRAEEIALSADSICFDAVSAEERQKIQVGIPGGFMVYNTLGVLAAARELGVSLRESAEALALTPRVKGRVEVVPTPGCDYTLLIDFAHTPDSLQNVLATVRGFAKGRVVALFGCGGDRDRSKRPKMGRIAAEGADFAIVTSDNPRTENPAAIIREILVGMEGSPTPSVVVEDRVEAIHYAMDHAKSGDVIVLCGKGHETYQIVGTEKHHMDEREIVAEHLKK